MQDQEALIRFMAINRLLIPAGAEGSANEECLCSGFGPDRSRMKQLLIRDETWSPPLTD